MIEAAMIWNEPNNKSHWDLEIDPEWSLFATTAIEAAKAIECANPALKRVLGGISPIDPFFIQSMAGFGVLDHVDVIAVHGFPLDWNLWPIHDWPKKISEIEAVALDHELWVTEVGGGNCASSLVQGVAYYQNGGANEQIGLLHWDLGRYRPKDIRFVAAWDIDHRKVGRDIAEAVFERPNCTAIFCDHVPKAGVTVEIGRVLDGYSDHMAEAPADRTFLVSSAAQPQKADIVRRLRETEAQILLNYLPIGSQKATEFYAECALEAGVAFVNNIPVFIASNEEWARRFAEAGVPIIGDDIKAQLGATIVHRILTNLFHKRGVKLDRTYQLNTGGNTDFLNMSNRGRLTSKKISKTEAVQSVAEHRLEDENIHIGPSDYIAWQNDNKICFLRMEGRLFGSVPMNLELRLLVEDSPNSAGVAIDMIRCARLALNRGLGGPIHPAAAYFCKHPPKQMTDDEAFAALERLSSANLLSRHRTH